MSYLNIFYIHDYYTFLFGILCGALIGFIPIIYVTLCCTFDLLKWKNSFHRLDVPEIPSANVRAFEVTLRHIMEWKLKNEKLPPDLYRLYELFYILLNFLSLLFYIINLKEDILQFILCIAILLQS